MARVKQPYDERRWVGWLGREVDPGETVEVPDRDLASYLESGWQPGQDKHTKDLVDALRKEQEPAADQQQGPGEQPGTSEES